MRCPPPPPQKNMQDKLLSTVGELYAFVEQGDGTLGRKLMGEGGEESGDAASAEQPGEGSEDGEPLGWRQESAGSGACMAEPAWAPGCVTVGGCLCCCVLTGVCPPLHPWNVPPTHANAAPARPSHPPMQTLPPRVRSRRSSTASRCTLS